MAESRVVRCGSEDAIVPSERLSILPFIAIGRMSAMHSRVWVLNEKVNWCLVIVKQAIDRKVVVMVASTMKENVIMMEWIIEERNVDHREERNVDHRDEKKVDHRDEKKVDPRDDRRSHTHDTYLHEERSRVNRHHSSRHSHEHSRSHRRERSWSQERRGRSRSRDDNRDDHHRASSRHHDRSRSYHTHHHYSVCEKKNAQTGDRTQDLRVISTTL